MKEKIYEVRIRISKENIKRIQGADYKIPGNCGSTG